MRWAGVVAALFLVALAVPLVPSHADEVHYPEEVPPPSRDVTPPGFTPAPITSGPLIREPLPPPPPEKPRWHRYFLPVTTDAATFVVSGQIPEKGSNRDSLVAHPDDNLLFRLACFYS